MVREIMEWVLKNYDESLPIIVDISSGNNWADAK
jgi:DNA polymerase I-like protein with 3'-5' exonuclease and polymerase domains